MKPDTEFLRNLEDYLTPFREAFRRREQAQWASVYVQGLLLDGERKSIEALAERVVLPPDLVVEDVAQALQHFVNQSPWDEQELARRYRTLLAGKRAHPEGVFVIGDVTFPKQGKHSVGVQRQYSGEARRKLNCQVAVGLCYVSPIGACPLAIRLYLPRGWIRDTARLETAGVPAEHRTHAHRAEIALELLDAVRGEGLPGVYVVAGAGYGAPEFCAGVAGRGLVYLAEVDEPVETAPGRVLTPPVEEGRHVLTNLPGDATAQQALDLWRCRERVREVVERLRRLGLDHFEGRSWQGFHHHVNLVMLASGYE